MGGNTELADVVEAVTPDNSTVLVVGAGDGRLLELPGRLGLRFPPAGEADAVADDPASDDEALAQLEELRRQGAGFLALRASAFDWLDRYPRLALALDTGHAGLIARTDECMVFDLGGAEEPKPAAAKVSLHEYTMLVARVKRILGAVVPEDETVLVVSKGDDRLIDLPGQRGWHFPRDEDGRYLGYYPEDDEEALAHLEELRSKGAAFLALPATAFWWLERYRAFAQALEQRFTPVAKTAACAVFDLRAAREAVSDGKAGTEAESAGAEEIELSDPLVRRVVGGLLPERSRVAVLSADSADLAGLRDHEPIQVPATAARDAIEAIRAAAGAGAQFLVIPRSSFDWLERNFELADHLGAHDRFIIRQGHACEIWELATPEGPTTRPTKGTTKTRGPLDVVRLWWKQRGKRGDDR
jgi:hypothetical protein